VHTLVQHEASAVDHPGQSFPRDARLTRSKDFERVLRRPEIRLRAGPLRLNAVFNRMHGARLGLVVGKKALPRAHARNRVKRVVRDRFRRQRNRLGAVDLVIRVVGPIQKSQLHDRLDELFAELSRKTDRSQDNESR
jgi:ribonuclease P protein component